MEIGIDIHEHMAAYRNVSTKICTDFGTSVPLSCLFCISTISTLFTASHTTFQDIHSRNQKGFKKEVAELLTKITKTLIISNTYSNAGRTASILPAFERLAGQL